MPIDPKKYPPSGHVKRLLELGRPPFKIVDFLRFDANGEVVAKVHVRLCSEDEKDHAVANAARECRRLLGEGVEDRELLANLRHKYLLAEACRDPDDPKRRFFEHGIYDVQRFNAEEIASLVLAYAELQEDAYPALREMTQEEYDKWVAIVAEGVLARPFSLFSPAKLETFTSSLARDLVETRARLASTTSSSTGGASSPPSDSGPTDPATA